MKGLDEYTPEQRANILAAMQGMEGTNPDDIPIVQDITGRMLTLRQLKRAELEAAIHHHVMRDLTRNKPHIYRRLSHKIMAHRAYTERASALADMNMAIAEMSAFGE